MTRITFATLFWEPNSNSFDFSTQYTTEWVEKLYRGFARNTTYDFDFIVYTDQLRQYNEPIAQKLLMGSNYGYGDCIQPYEMDKPMILVGLDTIITGNIDHLVEHCFKTTKVALPNAVYKKGRACNGVALVPGGMKHEYYDGWDGENDMDWICNKDHDRIDDLFPGHVVSYKGHVKNAGLGDSRIVFFHGKEKPDEVKTRWIRENWV